MIDVVLSTKTGTTKAKTKKSRKAKRYPRVVHSKGFFGQMFCNHDYDFSEYDFIEEMDDDELDDELDYRCHKCGANLGGAGGGCE